MNELRNFKAEGYKAEVIICTCPKELSWKSTIERAECLDSLGEQPRYVSKEHHDLVTEVLAKNVKDVYDSGLVSKLEIYSREAKLFDSNVNNPKDIEDIINGELNRLNSNINV